MSELLQLNAQSSKLSEKASPLGDEFLIMDSHFNGPPSLEPSQPNDQPFHQLQAESYLEIIGELETVGKLISQAKADLAKKKQSSNQQPERALQEMLAIAQEKDKQIDELTRTKKQLMESVKDNEQVMYDEGSSELTEHQRLRRQVTAVKSSIAVLDKEIGTVQTYYRFIVAEIVRQRHEKSEIHNEYGLSPQVVNADYENTLEQLRAVTTMQKTLFERHIDNSTMLKKQITELLKTISDKQNQLKRINSGIFSSYMHHNIKGPSKQGLTRPSSNRSQRSLRFATMGNSRQNSIKQSRQHSRQPSQLNSRSSRQLINGGEASVTNICFNDLFEIFAGNDRIKCLSKTRSDRKLLKETTRRMAAIRVMYSSGRKNFTFQAIYSDQANLNQPLNGVVHAALDIYDPLPPTTFTAIIQDLKSITVFSDASIRALGFSFKNGQYKLIGDSKRKVDGHEISFEGRTLKYIVSYWYAGEFAAVKFVYSKDDSANKSRKNNNTPMKFEVRQPSSRQLSRVVSAEHQYYKL